jgi:hypothetical protein
MAKITGAAARLLAQQLQCIMEKKGYAFFDYKKKAWNLNIIGVRSDIAKANKFDDSMYVVYRNSSREWEVRLYRITTDPGTYYLKNPMNVNGTAIVVPGQYRSAYKRGTHYTYEALVQRGKNPIKIYRDRDKDEILDMDPDTIIEGHFGINIHKAGTDSSIVHKWSAGCQVFKTSSDFNDFMKLIHRSESHWGKYYSYTLLEEKDFEGC